MEDHPTDAHTGHCRFLRKNIGPSLLPRCSVPRDGNSQENQSEKYREAVSPTNGPGKWKPKIQDVEWVQGCSALAGEGVWTP